MIYPSKVILKRIRQLSNKQSVRILTIQGRLINPETGEYIDCFYDYGGQLSALVDGLIRDGYLVRLDKFKVALTDKGLHPYAQAWESTKHFLFYSVFVPIVVSATTSLVVLWLQE